MDYQGIPRGTIRQEALKKLAKLTVEESSTSIQEVDSTSDNFTKLLSSTNKEDVFNPEDLSTVAITPKEYEVLLALCESTNEEFKFPNHAQALLNKFRLYFLELPTQKFSPTIVNKYSSSSTPWHTISESLTTAIIQLGKKFDYMLIDQAIEIFQAFNDSFFANKSLELSNYFTLLGCLSGLTKNADILTYSPRSFRLFLSLDTLIDNFDFLNDVEIYSNTIYSQQNQSNSFNDYSNILDKDLVIDFSPVLYLEYLGKLSCRIINSIIDNNKKPLLESIIERVASRYDDGSFTAHDGIFDNYLLTKENMDISREHMDIIKHLTEIAIQKMEFLDRGESYIVYSTYNRLRLGYSAKSYFLQVISCGIFTDNIDIKVSKRLFKNCLEIKDVMLDQDLGLSVIQLGSLLIFKDEKMGNLLTRSFTSLVSNPRFSKEYCLEASKSLGVASKVLSQDAVITTIYALTNLLFVGHENQQIRNNLRTRTTGLRDNGSLRGESIKDSISRSNSLSSIPNHGKNHGVVPEFNDSDYKKVCENAIIAIIEIAKACDDEKVTTLAVTLLSQKTSNLNSTIGPLLLAGLSSCAPYLPEREFVILIKSLFRLSLEAFESKNESMLTNLISSQVVLSKKLSQKSALFNVYLHELLQTIISKGDVQVLEHHRSHSEILEIGSQISIYLKPLSELLPNVDLGEPPLEIKSVETVNLFKNFWFNLVVHGYSVRSEIAKPYIPELERIAYNSPPLVSEVSWDRTETSLELNTILRRGSSNHNIKHHRTFLGEVFEVHRSLSYQKLIFLSSAMFLESLRVKTGDCSKILQYYSDPSVKTSGVDKFIGHISHKIMKDFVTLVNHGGNKQFSADNISHQLTEILALCCHRLRDLQDTAFQCCEILINSVPSSLIHQQSLFTLFDLLSVLYDSIVDADENLYQPTTNFKTRHYGIMLSLSDDYQWRKQTFKRFEERAHLWMKLVLLKSNFDVKSLIQSYVSNLNEIQSGKIHYGVSFALNIAGTVVGNRENFITNEVASSFHPHSHTSNVILQLNLRSDLMNKVPLQSNYDTILKNIKLKVFNIESKITPIGTNNDPTSLVASNSITDTEINSLLNEIAGLILLSDSNNGELIRYLVELPFKTLKASIINYAIIVWLTIMKDKPTLATLIIAEIIKHWEISVDLKLGLFSQSLNIIDSTFCKMEYSPSDLKLIKIASKTTNEKFKAHLSIIKLISSNFQATLNQSDHLLKIFTRFVEVGLEGLNSASLHPFSRLLRFQLVRFAFDVLNYHSKLKSRSLVHLTELIFTGSLSWFRQKFSYPYGGNLLKIKADFELLKEVTRLIAATETFGKESLESKKTIVLFFLDDEISKISIWLNPLNPNDLRGSYSQGQLSSNHIIQSYSIDPILAINLALRYKIKNLDDLLQNLITKNPLPSVFYPEAVQFFIGINGGVNMPNHYLLFWTPLPPIDCITLFLPPFGNNPYILQFTMRSLEHHDVNLTFFYVPQIVQSLRFDFKGYVERFIIETAKVSQLFAHQIIWNMLANSFKDEDSLEPDSLKPTLDKIQVKMLATFNAKDLDFYEKEFGFFNEVTDISGKLKPYIKKSKAEKKVKIDEEMYKIDVQPGVYLPSNPNGVVIDINRKSGKPLQSHAKAPFMATFKIQDDVETIDEFGKIVHIPIEKWQSAIFKVGDDCRQDVLALQLISVFRTIWNNAGLDLFVYPYRVTATAPGCGVIDVLPNSISRDMLGREAVNGLYQYFTTKFGPEESMEFQEAKNNFIKSLAAYSIISYLLQFKDRHNGNIMYDDQGHILHIDFGFCFDIVPGGVKFEVAPFKLTHEMILVLGGNHNTQAFRWFEELCVKGYLACRPYMETIVRCVTPMLESGLPCFKETTIKKLRSRFVPSKSEKDASVHMRGLIRKSMESYYTKGYDEFQRITNGIPY
ncbi:putative phosphatidylinositol 4-kinase [Suhomyces tanzawaensis NRRL Y-17324]|uniref:1-phosphatidylinositol 4-kinase n=1 Tax=Suhomyces tanzawaensis NRRL Y-17324 TaxID=984487 RepID=A0A1E4SNY8_9ASCO|nr:putative phosphatidylinositol 4-kinase [Suhomyces tanzawaensis NRRL Y-17324]ODV81198.1 putative phosphatidylinositol 4-kinase [Suhomyces tanzawaensis NRRL Y-17324]